MRARALTLAFAVAAGCGSSQRAGEATPEGAGEPDPAAVADAAPEQNDEAKEAEQVAAIEFVVNQTGEAVHACYKRATAEQLGLEGVVTLGVEHGAEGAVEVTVVGDGLGSAALNECLVEVFTAFGWPPVFEAGDAVQLPLSFVGASAQYTVHSGHVAVREPVPGLKAAVVLDAASTGNDAASMSLLELGAGLQVPLHVHTAAEVLYVLDGGGTVYGVHGERKGTPVEAGTAIYLAAGVAHAFVTGPDGARAVQLYAPGGAEQRFEGDSSRDDTRPMSAGEARKLARKKGTPTPRVAKVADAKRYTIAGGKGAVTFLFDEAISGDAAAYIGVLEAAPGMKVPEHAHAAETELLYVLAGEATMIVGGVEHAVAPGMGVQIPPGVRHSATVTSDGTLKVLQFYTPAGPEQRFKQ